MKNKIIILCLLQVLSFTSCDSDDDNNSQNPNDQLPPATMTGENTFGALIDGKPFIPGFVVFPTQCNYQLINGERFFFVTGRYEEQENFNLISLSLYTNAKTLEVGQTYQLFDRSEGNVSGSYGYNGDFFDTTSQNSGELTITRLDLNAQIIAGTFFYDIIDGNGDLRQIRDGRFDMQFTQ